MGNEIQREVEKFQAEKSKLTVKFIDKMNALRDKRLVRKNECAQTIKDLQNESAIADQEIKKIEEGLQYAK